MEIFRGMKIHEKYIKRCIEIAKNGLGTTAPNPMVGCVIVHNNKIIAEGFTSIYGGSHAEVNAIKAIKDSSLLSNATLYVTLEPCSHFGKTPPCSDLIIKHNIKHVVIGCLDSNPLVAGRGIAKLKAAGCEVITGVLEKDCREHHKRFFTFHEKNRPFIILKWAQTLDGYIDIDRSLENFGEPTWITGDLALRLVHKIRSEEGAILVGNRTAQKDNPCLTVRHWSGDNPLRAVIDKKLQLLPALNLFDGSEKTLVFNSKKETEKDNISWIKINFDKNVIPQILAEFHRRKILSVIVEGGKFLLESFIDSGLWDEAHIFIGNKFFYGGIRAPRIKNKITGSELLGTDWLKIIENTG